MTDTPKKPRTDWRARALAAKAALSAAMIEVRVTCELETPDRYSVSIGQRDVRVMHTMRDVAQHLEDAARWLTK